MTGQNDRFNQGNKQEFVHEHIKEKPFNWKKLKKNLLESALCGAVFALSAGLVFGMISFLLPDKVRSTERADLAVVDGDNSTEETEVTEDVSRETEAAEPVVENVIIEQVSLTLEDYQKLQNQMYSVGSLANKSIVAITSVVAATDWFHHTYEMDHSGTGVIIAETAEELLILTEQNAISNPKEIYVSFINDVTVEAELKAWDKNTGIVILSVPRTSMDDITGSVISVAKICGSRFQKSGQLVIALGSPLGMPFSIATGCITSNNHMVSRWDSNFNVYTTDIHGNAQSSGVLIDVNGEVVGLIMQGYRDSSDHNLAAIPILETTELIELLMDGEEIPYAGLYLSAVTDKIVRLQGLPKGLYVREVGMDSPAMEAGLQSGDVITAVNGEAVVTVDRFYQLLLAEEVGSEMKIAVQRQSGEDYIEVVCDLITGTLE